MSKTQNVGKLWLKKYIRPYRACVLFLACLTIMATLFSLAFAYLVRYLINSATNQQVARLWGFTAVVLGLVLLKIILKTLTGYFSERYRAKMVSNLRVKLYSKVLYSEYLSLQNYHSGDILTRLTADIQEVAATSVGLLPAVSGMLVQCIGAIVALLTIDPLFTLIYVLCGGIFAGVTALFRQQIKKRQKAVLEADGNFRSYMQEGYSSLLTIKAYGVEEKTTVKAERFADKYFQKRLSRNRINAMMSFVYGLLSNFGLIFAVVWCSFSVLTNANADYGAILSVILLLMQLQHPLSAFSSIIPAYYGRISSGERLAEIDALPRDGKMNATDEILSKYEQIDAIALKNVSFSYGREPVLKSVDFSIKTGKIVCLTGISGTGKSTLFKLLLNVLSPQEGNLVFLGDFDGENEITLSSQTRNMFAYVPQGNFLFSGTIYENLIFFTEEKEALAEKISEALRIACAEFVYELPNGLQTQLGEGGVGLSEGQRQRLAIARAVLSHRPILLLDEATSALDAETEQMLLQNIKQLTNKTCLMVTHRPAALEIADSVLLLENGKISIKS